jgi:RNA polymerase subunit RPABC4/transcription elongation factor Spt4
MVTERIETRRVMSEAQKKKPRLGPEDKPYIILQISCPICGSIDLSFNQSMSGHNGFFVIFDCETCEQTFVYDWNDFIFRNK